MGIYQREWAADFLQAAAEVTKKDREIGKRLKIVWRSLPTQKPGRDVKMTPVHGNVYMALVAHTSGLQDMDGDSIQSDASNIQVSTQCFWSVSQVEEVLAELEMVGFIHRRRRPNKSSLTTIFRTPGNFGGAKGPTMTDVESESSLESTDFQATSDGSAAATAPTRTGRKQAAAKDIRLEDIDIPALAAKIEQAAQERGLEYKPGKLQKMIDDAIHQIFFWEEGRAIHVWTSAESWVDWVGPMLPKGLVPMMRLEEPGLWVISRKPEDLASLLIKHATGKNIAFGAFSPAMRHRKDLHGALTYTLQPGALIYEKLKAADSPAGYLTKSMEGLFAEWDAEEGKAEANDSSADGLESSDDEDGDEDWDDVMDVDDL